MIFQIFRLRSYPLNLTPLSPGPNTVNFDSEDPAGIWELAMIFSCFAGIAAWTQDRQGTLNPSKPWWSRVPPAIFLGPKIAKVSLDLTLREGPSEDEDWSL